MDGKGYPDRLAGAEIPRGSRVIAVCDAYDAMISNRPYRTAMSQEGALEELRRNSGTQFDPVVVDAFISVLAEPKRTTIA
jgi:HD-GYP domain-containing protein (c-di-GMP phosphodiesterase class II)